MNSEAARIDRLLPLLRCPRCASPLRRDGLTESLVCTGQSHGYSLERGLPRLLPVSGEEGAEPVTRRIRRFYEENPFPDYDGFEDLATLLERAQEGVFARLLDEQIPFGTRVLECGCGTGQLANFLGIAHRTVIGTDLSLASLALAEEFRARHGLQRVYFLQMDLFHPVFPDACFDVVICNGVLHHTADPRGGFLRLARLVRPGGHLLVGLYHRYGRLPTDLRRLLFRLLGPRFPALDPRFRRQKLAGGRWAAWFADQYRNPHETSHTIGSVLKWLPEAGLELVKTIPKTRLGEGFSETERLFEPEPPGGAVERFLCEVAQLWSGSREGGFFTVIGRRIA